MSIQCSTARDRASAALPKGRSPYPDDSAKIALTCNTGRETLLNMQKVLARLLRGATSAERRTLFLVPCR
jgi:hypothetical protein